MAFGFNPFTGNFDLTGGGDAAPFAGQVDAYADLPLDSAAALNSRWLVKNNSGTWPFSNYKQAGIYIRVSTAGASRDTDYQFVGTLPSVMNDSEFLVYDDTDATKNLKFQLSGIAPGTTRTITMPNANVTLPNQGTSTTDSPTFQKITISGDEINGTAGAIHYRVSSEDPIGNQAIPYFAVESYDQDTENRVGFALLGVRADKAFIQGESADFRIEQSGGGLANIKAHKLVLEDATTAGDPTATFDADGNLTANRTYDLPNASGTIALTSLVGASAELVIACSDETSNLTTGTAKVTFRMPYAMTLSSVRASVNTAPTGSTLVVDINEGGSTILSTKLSIDASELTSTTAATAAVISDTALADDASITIDIDQIGSTVAGKGLKVILRGTRA
jgi:hypothetical protein